MSTGDILDVSRDVIKKSGIECHGRFYDGSVNLQSSREILDVSAFGGSNWAGLLLGPTSRDVIFRREACYVDLTFRRSEEHTSELQSPLII